METRRGGSEEGVLQSPQQRPTLLSDANDAARPIHAPGVAGCQVEQPTTSLYSCTQM